jgi:hypothetical protein
MSRSSFGNDRNGNGALLGELIVGDGIVTIANAGGDGRWAIIWYTAWVGCSRYVAAIARGGRGHVA